PEGASGDVSVRAAAGGDALAGGAETVEVPAQAEITLNAKKLAKGDSITIVTAGATFSAVADEKDAASEQPLVALLKKLTEPMKGSKALRDPQARAAGADRTHIVVALASAKRGEEGNGQEVEVRFEKQKDSDFSVQPVGKLKLDGGAVRRSFASVRLEFAASFAPPQGAEAVLDTARLGDGRHELTLVAEEDTDAAVQGFATAEVRVANGKGKVALNLPRKPDFSKPFAVTATLSGTYPGGAKRFVLVVDGRDAGDLEPNSKKLVLDRAKVPLGAGRHTLQVRAEPKQAENPPLLSEPVEVEVPAAAKK
ncbi:MAG: hypothetical protein MUC63_05685, partial [Planctomycetes bacterium]|nr:hypothetical protein [Planctomycetota bacterium]